MASTSSPILFLLCPLGWIGILPEQIRHLQFDIDHFDTRCGKEEDKVCSNIALYESNAGETSSNQYPWIELPLAQKIGVPLKFRLLNDPDFKGIENMFAEVMSLKIDDDTTYWPDNPQSEPILGSIAVARTDGQDLRIKDVQVLWDYIHEELRTEDYWGTEIKLLPQSYLQTQASYESKRDPVERRRDNVNKELLTDYIPPDDVSKAIAADRQALRVPLPEELVTITPKYVEVADRKYLFDVLREAWQADEKKAKKDFVKYWKHWRKDKMKVKQDREVYKKLECPAKDEEKHKFCSVQ